MKRTNPTLITKLQIRDRRTPDFSELRWYKEVPIFVYGTEMYDGIHHEYLKDADYCGRAVTVSPNYMMKKTEREPIVFATNDYGNIRNKVKGELYIGSVEHIHALDYLKVHTVATRRFKTKVMMMDQKESHFKYFGGMPVYSAFMYLGVPEAWENQQLQSVSGVRYVGDAKIGAYPVFEWTNWRWKDEEPAPDPNDDEQYQIFWNSNYPEYGYENSLL